jgi:predicted RNase H-like HicB family nuclease
MRLMVELDRETDGRWIAEVVDLPGVLVYGATRDEALAGAQALALRVVADKLEHEEAPAVPLDLSFVVNAA